MISSWMRNYDIFSPYCYDCGMLNQFIYYSSDAHILNSCLLDDPRLGLLAYTPVDLYAVGSGTPSTRPFPCSSVIHYFLLIFYRLVIDYGYKGHTSF